MSRAPATRLRTSRERILFAIISRPSLSRTLLLVSFGRTVCLHSSHLSLIPYPTIPRHVNALYRV